MLKSDRPCRRHPSWTYLFVVLPMIKVTLATAFVLQCFGGQDYDLIVAMTQGGPGIATQMPAVFVIEHITNRQNGISMAGHDDAAAVIVCRVRGFFQWRTAPRQYRARGRCGSLS